MKKRVIGLTLVVCLLFSTTAFASSTSISQMSPDMNAAIEVATSYLEDAAYSQYFYDVTPGHSRLLRKTWSCIGTVLPTMGILTS